MSRYIDADALKKRVEDSNKSAGLHLEDLRKIRKWINSAPSIDIVRCGECKHWHKWSDFEMFCGHFDGGIGSDADDFCSYGEREGE